MKKTFIIFIQVAFLLLLGVSGAAASGWEPTVTPTGISQATVTGNTINLTFSGANSSRSAAVTKDFDLSKNEQISISFDASFAGTSTDINRRVIIQESGKTGSELLNFTGSSLEVLKNEVKTGLAENKKYKVRIGIKPTTSAMVVWLDNEKVYDGNISGWNVNNLSNAQIYIRNNTTKKDVSITSTFTLADFAVGNKATSITTVPENGTAVDASGLDKIEVKFNAAVSASTLNDSNFVLKKDGNVIGFTAQYPSVDKAVITPSDGFAEMSEYEVTVKSVTDFFGQESAKDLKASFTTTRAGYIPPTVSIAADSDEIFDTSSTTVNITAQSTEGIDRIELYVDDVKTEEFANTENASYTFRSAVGTHTLYAKVYDELGGTTKSSSITITVSENKVPVIQKVGVEDGVSYQKEALSAVKITAKDADSELDRIEVYVGSEPVRTFNNLNCTVDGSAYSAEVTVDLSNLAMGRHMLAIRAYDKRNAVGIKEISFVVAEKGKENAVFDSDFNTYESDGTTNPGFEFIRNGDFKTLSSSAYGSDHGTVLELSTEGKLVEEVSAEGSWARLPTSNAKSAFEIEMDIYFHDKNSNLNFILYQYDPRAIMTQVEFNKNGNLSLHNNKTNGYKTADVEINKWHHIKYRIDNVSHTYSFWLDGELLADEFGTNESFKQVETRMVFSFINQTPEQSKIAIDNLSVTYIDPRTQITAVGYDNVSECSTVSPEARTLNFTINASLTASTVNKDGVVLYCGNEKMEYDSVSYDDTNKRITIILTEPLVSDKDYSLMLNSSVKTSGGIPLTSGAFAYFKTGFKPFDVTTSKIEASGSEVYGTGSITNDTDSEKSCIVILNIFNGTKLVDMKASVVNVNANSSKTFTTDKLTFAAGYTAEMYFWDSISAQSAVTMDICTK